MASPTGPFGALRSERQATSWLADCGGSRSYRKRTGGFDRRSRFKIAEDRSLIPPTYTRRLHLTTWWSHKMLRPGRVDKFLRFINLSHAHTDRPLTMERSGCRKFTARPKGQTSSCASLTGDRGGLERMGEADGRNYARWKLTG